MNVRISMDTYMVSSSERKANRTVSQVKPANCGGEKERMKENPQ
jgi:hypothetical protein